MEPNPVTQPPAGVMDYLLSMGLPGLVILGLGYALVRIFGLYTAAQEKRIEEAGAYKVALLEVTNQLRVMTEAINTRRTS
jgi:hypothetical protein